MNRVRKYVQLLWLVVPLTWGLIGCSGGDQGSQPGGAKEPSAGSGSATKETGTTKPEAAAVEGFGTISGRIVYGGSEVPATTFLVQGGKYQGQEAKNFPRCGETDIPREDLVVNPDNKGIKNAVVFLFRPRETHSSLLDVPQEPAVLGQQFCQFQPHVLAVREGQKLMITASDPGVGHNTNISGLRTQFNVLIPAPVDEAKPSEVEGPEMLAEPNAVPVACNVHPWMSAKVWVFDHPYYAVTGDDGSFELQNVPAGDNQLVIWQEKLGYSKPGKRGMTVEVKPDETTDLGGIVLEAN